MNDHIYDIIAKTLNGEGSGEDQQQLQTWLNADPLHIREYEEIKTLWHDADEVLAIPEFNTTAAWEKVSSKIAQNTEEKNVSPKGRVISFSPAIKMLAAAAVVLLGIFLLRPLMGDGLTEVVAMNTNETIVLPDNSQVVLRKGSTLKYPSAFKGKERHVVLEGEAFFEVTRNEQQPFTIDAQAVEVTVLGTSFNVHCEERKAIVTVASGKVQVAKGEKKIILEKGQEGTYASGSLVKGEATGEGYLYWQTGELKYELVPLATVVADLSKVLHISLKLDKSITPEMQEKPVNVTFNKKSTEQILDELCLITGCKWSRINDEYIISAK